MMINVPPVLSGAALGYRKIGYLIYSFLNKLQIDFIFVYFFGWKI